MSSLQQKALLLVTAIIAMDEVEEMMLEEKKDEEKKHRPRKDNLATEALWSQAAATPQLYRNLCRFTREEVLLLAEQLDIDIGDAEGIDLSSHKGSYTPLRMLEYFLHCLAVTSSFRTVENFFCWHRSSLSKNFYYHIDLILERMDFPNQEWAIKWFSANDFAQFRQHPLDSFPNCFAVVDATYIFVPEPKDPLLVPIYQSSYKSHQTCVFFIVVCDRRGKIIYCDRGSVPAIATNREGLAFTRCREYVPPDLKILGDKAYTYDERCLTPHKRDYIRRFTAADRQVLRAYNRELSSQRTVIENVFAFLKNLWRCIGSKYTRNVTRVADVFRVCCILSNFLFHVRQTFPRSQNFDVNGGVNVQLDNLD